MSDFRSNSGNNDTSSDVKGSSFDPAFDGKTTPVSVYRVVVALSDFVNGMKKKYEDELDKVSKSIGTHNKAIEEQERELKNSRTDNAKSLAVFVAFFTFVSISFSILPRVSEPLVLLGILLVLLGSLTFFVALLAWILDVQRDKWFTNKQRVVGVVALLLLVGGLTSAFLGYQDMKNNDFYTQGEVNNLLNDQKGLLESKIQDGES